MQPIIDKLERNVLIEELQNDCFVRPTNNGNNKIYIFNGNKSPNLLKELGRLRELTFRAAGGGTGKNADIDEFDTGDFAYQQLIVWNTEDQEIVGGYRYKLCGDARDSKGNYHLSTSEIVTYSEKMKNDFFPWTIELGRSFVQPQYQPSIENRKGLFSLDNLWDGLGALTVIHPSIRYFFGKVTMYTDFNRQARDLILSFMHHFFPDPDVLISIPNPLQIETDCSAFIQSLQGKSYKEGHQLLNHDVRALGENIPPLVNSYMNISPTMKTFGTSINSHFGAVEETGIMITIADIYLSKKDRHVNSYMQYLASQNG